MYYTGCLYRQSWVSQSPFQQYDHTATINAVRAEVDKWRQLPNQADWRVTPETARLLLGDEVMKAFRV